MSDDNKDLGGEIVKPGEDGKIETAPQVTVADQSQPRVATGTVLRSDDVTPVNDEQGVARDGRNLAPEQKPDARAADEIAHNGDHGQVHITPRGTAVEGGVLGSNDGEDHSVDANKLHGVHDVNENDNSQSDNRGQSNV